MTTSISDRIAAAKAKLNPVQRNSVLPLQALKEITGTKADVKQAVEQDNGVANNQFYKIISDVAKSNDQKIQEIAKYLTTENNDYDLSRQRFAEFEAYFNYVQGQNMELDVQGIESLMKELKSALKPEVEKIVADVIEVQKGVEQSRRLLEALRAARIEDKTIDQISAAMKLNEKITAEMKDISETLDGLAETEKKKQDVLVNKQEEEKQSKVGFKNRVARLFYGPDKEIANDIDNLNEQIAVLRAEIEANQQELKDKGVQRDEHLESGPLVILRGMDATEKSFSDNLVTTAERSIELIERAKRSIQILLKRTAYCSFAFGKRDSGRY